jgi:DNA invertase Pin-like site-specific DNA recombinase
MNARPLPAKRTRVSARRRRAQAAADLAVAVLRVSTQGQADSGLGIDAQREAVEAFAATQGLQLVAVVEDTASGTLSPSQRPGMAHALDLLASGEAGLLVAARADRLTRKTADLYALMDQSSREGWCIRTADGVVNTCSESGRLMAQVAGLFAEQERRLISSRTKAALQAKKASGGRLGAPVRTAEPTRARVRELRHEGLTMAEIAGRLNADGVTTATGRPWTWQNVRRVTASLALDDAAPGRRVTPRANRGTADRLDHAPSAAD